MKHLKYTIWPVRALWDKYLKSFSILVRCAENSHIHISLHNSATKIISDNEMIYKNIRIIEIYLNLFLKSCKDVKQSYYLWYILL